MKKSMTVKILEDMDTGKTLSNVDMSKRYGWRFGGHLYNLRKYGVRFEKKKGEGYIEYFTLKHIPAKICYKGRSSIKIMKQKKLLQKLMELYTILGQKKKD